MNFVKQLFIKFSHINGPEFFIKFLKIPSLKSNYFTFITLLMSNMCPSDQSHRRNLQLHIYSFLTGVYAKF